MNCSVYFSTKKGSNIVPDPEQTKYPLILAVIFTNCTWEQNVG